VILVLPIGSQVTGAVDVDRSIIRDNTVSPSIVGVNEFLSMTLVAAGWSVEAFLYAECVVNEPGYRH